MRIQYTAVQTVPLWNSAATITKYIVRLTAFALDIHREAMYNNSRRKKARSWRNRQTRTFEGRMGDRMGSSPIDRTKNPGFSTRIFLCLKCLKSNDYKGFLKLRISTWISFGSLKTGCVAHRLHTLLDSVFSAV